MAISRWDPFGDITAWREQMDRLFGRTGREDSWTPSVDVFDGPDELDITAELPGVDPADIDVSVTESALTLRGERRLEERSEEEGTYRVERRYGRFERSIPLPDNVDLDAIEATAEQGVLTVRVPKVAAATPRHVQVTRGGAGGRSGLPMQQTDVDLSTSSRSEPPIVPEREVQEGLEPGTPTGTDKGGGEQAA